MTQLELIPLAHTTTVYAISALWRAWRCTCGRDVGTEGIAYSHDDLAEVTATRHRRVWAMGGAR